MLDLKVIRDHPDRVREALARRRGSATLDQLLELERQRRELIGGIDQDRHKLNILSDEFAEAKRKGAAGGPPEELRELSASIKERDTLLRDVEEQVAQQVALIPNIPHDSVPVGGPEANRIERVVGEKPEQTFKARTHIELGESLGILDLARAAKISGSHFPLFSGAGAGLQRALINFMLDVHTREHGYTEQWPPVLVNRASMFGTGQLPKFEEDMYRLKDDDLFLIPTAEVPVTNLLRDEILDEARLPIAYTAYTPCFRREAGSYGKDTRGLVRVHQFDKIELVRFATPETSYAEHEKLVGHAETILKRLGLHYRVVCLSTGDLGFAAAKCYDLEAWAPGLGQFLEVSSCSNFEDFQARRANIKYRQAATKKTAYVHTLNGSGVALARTMICLLETHQQADGTIRVPEVLRPYLNGQSVLGPARGH